VQSFKAVVDCATSVQNSSCVQYATGLHNSTGRPSNVRVQNFTATSALTDEEGSNPLVFMHMPFSFGHTLERIAMMPPTSDMNEYANVMVHATAIQARTYKLVHDVQHLREDLLEFTGRPDAIFWGHAHPQLMDYTGVTGFSCPLAFTPQVYWAEEYLQSYFGKQPLVFGLLRNPYERLVSIFRSGAAGYANSSSESYSRYLDTCDVNGWVRDSLQKFTDGAGVKGKSFDSCLFFPQSAYFAGPHGIKLAVDARKFPQSMNQVLHEHGLPDLQIKEQDIVQGLAVCDHVWAGSLTANVKDLIQKVYRSDFLLLCKHFGYCDFNEPSCISGVPGNCPGKVLAKELRKAGHSKEESRNIKYRRRLMLEHDIRVPGAELDHAIRRFR